MHAACAQSHWFSAHLYFGCDCVRDHRFTSKAIVPPLSGGLPEPFNRITSDNFACFAASYQLHSVQCQVLIAKAALFDLFYAAFQYLAISCPGLLLQDQHVLALSRLAAGQRDRIDIRSPLRPAPMYR